MRTVDRRLTHCEARAKIFILLSQHHRYEASLLRLHTVSKLPSEASRAAALDFLYPWYLRPWICIHDEMAHISGRGTQRHINKKTRRKTKLGEDVKDFSIARRSRGTRQAHVYFAQQELFEIIMSKVRSSKQQFEVPNDFPNHPGGQTTLKSARDVADQKHKEIMFLAYHMGCDLDGKISQAAKSRNVSLPERGEIYNEIHQAILQIKKDHPYQALIYQAWCFFITITFWAALVGLTLTGNSYYAILFGLCVVSYSTNIFHGRHHRGGKVYTDFPWLDRMTAPLYDIMDHTYNIDPKAWRQHHNECHHIVTNHPHDDYDVLQPQQSGFRIHPAHPYKWYHQFQPLYVPLLLSINAFAFPWNNLLLYKGSWGYFVLHYITLFVLPTYFCGYKGLFCGLKCMLVTSTTISYVFQVSHNHSALHFSANTSKKTNCTTTTTTTIDDWIRGQMNDSVSWGGYWDGLLFGGLNYQVEHHIAPALPSTLYHYLSPVLQRIADPGDYIYEPNFPAAVWSYHVHLYRMSLTPNNKKT